MNEEGKSVKNWLLKNGYPFEMKVASLFKKSGFKISQSVFYKDEDTDKLREIDLIAYLNKNINGVSFSISFIIECKKSTGKPWLVFKNKHLINPKLNRFEPYATRNAKILLEKTKAHKIYKSVFPDIDDAGYNVVIAFREGKDLAYSASESLIKASNYLVDMFNNSRIKQCNIYVPLIIIEGNLYDSFLDENEEIAFELVNHSSVMTTKVFGNEPSNLITIASSKNLKEYIETLKREVLDFFNTYDIEMDSLSTSNPTNEKDICLGA